MNKKKLLIILLLILVIGMIWFLVAKSGNQESISDIHSANGNTPFEKIENALKANDFTYDYMPKVGTNYGASNGAEYALSDGTVIEVYSFVENSVVYKDILKSGKMYILNTETKYKVDTVEELNIAIRYVNEGNKVGAVKEMLK